MTRLASTATCSGVRPAAFVASISSRREGCQGFPAALSTVFINPTQPPRAARCSAVSPDWSAAPSDAPPRDTWRYTAVLFPSDAAASMPNSDADAAAEVASILLGAGPRSSSCAGAARESPGDKPGLLLRRARPTRDRDGGEGDVTVRVLVPLAPSPTAPSSPPSPFCPFRPYASPSPSPVRGTSNTKSPAGNPVGTPSASSQNSVNPLRPLAAYLSPTTSETHLARYIRSPPTAVSSPASSPAPTGPLITVTGRRRCALSATTSRNVAGTLERDMASQYARRTAALYRSSSSSPYAPDSASARAISPTSTMARRQLSIGAPLPPLVD